MILYFYKILNPSTTTLALSGIKSLDSRHSHILGGDRSKGEQLVDELVASFKLNELQLILLSTTGNRETEACCPCLEDRGPMPKLRDHKARIGELEVMEFEKLRET